MTPQTRPAGVAAVAAVFLLAAGYLLVIGLLMLLRPGIVSMAAGADLLDGLEVAGPYMFLLMAAVAGTIAAGLLRLHNWARRVALLVAMIGFALLVPSVSSAVIGLRVGPLARSGLGLIVRMVIVYYLYQAPVREAFEAK